MAIVISIIILFLGVLGIKTLPIAQFPNIAPPTVMVSISFPGASANVPGRIGPYPVGGKSINGVQNTRLLHLLLHQRRRAAIVIYFEPGTDPNINVVNLPNRGQHCAVPAARPWSCAGILVDQVVPSMLMYVNLYSTDPNAEQKDLFNLANV